MSGEQVKSFMSVPHDSLIGTILAFRTYSEQFHHHNHFELINLVTNIWEPTWPLILFLVWYGLITYNTVPSAARLSVLRSCIIPIRMLLSMNATFSFCVRTVPLRRKWEIKRSDFGIREDWMPLMPLQMAGHSFLCVLWQKTVLLANNRCQSLTMKLWLEMNVSHLDKGQIIRSKKIFLPLFYLHQFTEIGFKLLWDYVLIDPLCTSSRCKLSYKKLIEWFIDFEFERQNTFGEYGVTNNS